MKRWAAFLVTPVDAASIGVFRIVFGAMVAVDAARYLAYDWVDYYYVQPKIHFTYLFFDFVKPWPEPWMHVHFWFIGFTALLVAVGLYYRIAIVFLFFAYTYVFLLEESVYMNHYYLIALISFLMIWIPAQRVYSLDRWRADMPDTVPRWCVLILRFQLFITYFYGAIAKLNHDWLAGEPMYSEIVRHGPDVPEIALHFPPALLAYAIAYGGIFVDFAVPMLLVIPRTRPAGFALAVVFHALNAIFLRIGIFSYLMIGAILIFFSPSWPRRVWRRISNRSMMPAPPIPPARSVPLGGAKWLALLALHAYVIAQLLIPLRHWLYPGEVSWTEEGHRFSWHMKLRKKDSVLTITATDPASGRSWRIDPMEDLNARQIRKLKTFPDILLQYVHHHRDRLREQGIENPVITVDWLCSLNGTPHQRLVDPTRNLAAVEQSWRPATWILPRQPRADEASWPGRVSPPRSLDQPANGDASDTFAP